MDAIKAFHVDLLTDFDYVVRGAGALSKSRSIAKGSSDVVCNTDAPAYIQTLSFRTTGNIGPV